MAHSTVLHVRVDEETKTQASEALASMGLSMPNAETRAAMIEARAMAKARAARFESADALFDDLEKTRQS
ncbi:MAG: damage-inducible protein [Burkholderiales bacterium 66-5]|uniref:type II toxin-antitoxin system RelB/DinJ family antitoxin n=1 Tax=Comamonas badia TaxID=265291 RepID=UPI0004168034|nr:type II toxin-antitoxin system RelB/DinJ family antitoxin [Comamonas badia]OJU87192.1 MAG: damage-inducible protein [Burkholderiales bacterium 66-5]